MQEPNTYGCYQPDITTELARQGRSIVQAEIALCQDGLYHFALRVHCSDRGMGGPITTDGEGFASAKAAEDAALLAAIAYFGRDNSHAPASTRRERDDLRAQLERRFSQPLLL